MGSLVGQFGCGNSTSLDCYNGNCSNTNLRILPGRLAIPFNSSGNINDTQVGSWGNAGYTENYMGWGCHVVMNWDHLTDDGCSLHIRLTLTVQRHVTTWDGHVFDDTFSDTASLDFNSFDNPIIQELDTYTLNDCLLFSFPNEQSLNGEYDGHRIYSIRWRYVSCVGSIEVGSGENCQDLRTSVYPDTLRLSVNYVTGMESSSDIIQIPVNGSNGDVSFVNTFNDKYYNIIKSIACRFENNTNVRNVGIVNVYGTFRYSYYDFVEYLIDLVDYFEPDSEILFASFNFSDSCSNFPSSYSENLTSAIQELDMSNMSDNLFCYTRFRITRIEVRGFGALEDYCCDSESETPNTNDGLITIEEGIEGMEVDLSCVCQGLSNIATLLSTLNNSLGTLNTSVSTGLADNTLEVNAVKNAIEDKVIPVTDIDCICDNLENIDDTMSGLTLSPVNNVSVSPPVNNVSVNPPVNNITVQPSSAQVTVNPTDVSGVVTALGNISTQASNISSNVDGVATQDGYINQSIELIRGWLSNAFQPTVEEIADSQDTIANNGGVDLTDLIEEIHEALHVDVGENVEENITSVLKNKEMGCDVYVTIEPNDLLTYRKVFKADDES